MGAETLDSFRQWTFFCENTICQKVQKPTQHSRAFPRDSSADVGTSSDMREREVLASQGTWEFSQQ